MEIKNLNLIPADLVGEEPVQEEHMQVGDQATMDVTGSLRKIARELTELNLDSPEAPSHVEAAAWLIEYIANCLDVEISHAVERGRRLSSQMNGNVEIKETKQLNPSGQRIYGVISGEEI